MPVTIDRDREAQCPTKNAPSCHEAKSISAQEKHAEQGGQCTQKFTTGCFVQQHAWETSHQ